MEPSKLKSLSLALYQPDIPQNTGNLMRTAACMGVALDIIEPCGFVLSDKGMRRAGMDYGELATLRRHNSWEKFREFHRESRIVLLSTKADVTLDQFTFQLGDVLLLGRESAGVPDDVHEEVACRVRLPMAEGARSMNVSNAGAIAAFEALRQLQALPGE